MKAIFSNIMFKETIILFLLQHLLMIYGRSPSAHNQHFPFSHSLETDKAALLAFRKTISTDPYSKLENWNESNYVCNFTGVACDKRHLHRVVILNLNNAGLVGILSPSISNLTQLRALELMNNQFFGFIPSELSSLGNLRYLNLGWNILSGPIPDSFSYLAKLRLVSFNGNKLNGTLSPSFFSNCTSLRGIDFSDNFMTGNIPSEIGTSQNLWILNLYENQLIGEIPFSVINASQLYDLDVENNKLSGELPAAIISHLPNIVYLHLSNNQMNSQDGNTNLEPFFTALSNCSHLEELELAGIGLGGSLHPSIGGISVYLQIMVLQENHIHGSIPPEIARLSNLKLLNLSFNQFCGTIPAEIGQISYLKLLSLSYNYFSGEIPAALGQLSYLHELDLSNNQLSGEIPESLGNLSIYVLVLNNNILSGQIPPSLGKCINLYKLDLSYNKLTGSIHSKYFL